MVAIGIGQTVEVLESGKQGVIFDIFTADDGSWAVGVLFGDDDTKYFRTNELDFIEHKSIPSIQKIHSNLK